MPLLTDKLYSVAKSRNASCTDNVLHIKAINQING